MGCTHNMSWRYVILFPVCLVLIVLYSKICYRYHGFTPIVIPVPRPKTIFIEKISSSAPHLESSELRQFNTPWQRLLNVTANYPNSSSCQSLLKFLLLKPGISELDQLETFLNIPESLMESVSKIASRNSVHLFYNYTINIFENCMYFLVYEHRLNGSERLTTLPRGGTGFHTIVEGKQTIAYCPYVDLKNDTYAILCPLHEYCATVTSRLFYFDYLAFYARPRYVPDYRIIFKFFTCYNIKSYFPKPALYWTKKDNSENNNTSPFPWKLTGRVKEPLTTSQLQTCITSANISYNFIGDSHSRNMAYYFSRLNGNLTNSPIAHFDQDLGKVRIYFTTFIIESFLPKVRQVLTEFKLNSSQVFTIMNVGTWNMDRKNISHFAKVAIPTFRQQMLAMQHDGLLDKRRVLFYAMPSAPLWQRQIVHKRNTMATAAMYRLMVDALSDINITFFEYFILSRQFANETAPGDLHYLVTSTRGSSGYVGIELANYVIQIICREMKE